MKFNNYNTMKTQNSILSYSLIILALSIFLLSPFVTHGQVKKPVTVTTTLTPPYSMYLEDYIAPGSKKCRVNLMFNDYNEPSWNVYLHLTIESTNIKLETKQNYRPSSPITLTPGVNKTIKGSELYKYFDFDNLNCSGISKKRLANRGRLPEGFYTFTFKVKDYETGKVISNEGKYTANLRLNKPPKIIQPDRGEVTEPSQPQNFNFQWQLQNATSQKVNYKLHVFKMLDSSFNPRTALKNNQVVKIFESEETNITTYNYSSADPKLKKGNTYIYYLQAIHPEGRTIWQNEGKSQVSWFHYGYPTGGHIELESPADEHGFTLRENKYFSWGPPNNLTDQQQYHYQMNLVELKNGEDPQKAIDRRSYHQVTTTTITRERGWSKMLGNIHFETNKQYAWQVKAFTKETEIAASKVYTFTGPPYLEAFKAGNHEVRVTKTTTTDFENLSGEGKIQFSQGGATHKVKFDSIRVKRTGAEIFLRKGRCVAECKIPKIELTPKNTDNGKAYFVTDSVLLNRHDLKIKGHVEWELPHATRSEEKAIVTSKPVALKYNNFKLLGTAHLKENQEFELLNPANFNLKLKPKSRILINNNRYKLHLDGKIKLPPKIKGSEKDTISLPFLDKQQMFYFNHKDHHPNNEINLVPKTNMFLLPNDYTIDLSGNKSPPKLSDSSQWKGVYFNKYTLHYRPELDKKKQISCKEHIHHTINLSDDNSYRAHAGSAGMNLYTDYDFNSNDRGYFNTFPSQFKHITLRIENNKLKEGKFKGSIKIPVLSESKDFAYTVPLTHNGFKKGYLHEVEEKKFVYNADGGEQKMKITVNRAVFQNNRLLDMNIDLKWPYTGITMEGLNHFRIWGDYKIGFIKPSGAAQLTQQKTGEMNGFEVTIDHIGCGRQGDLYAIGTAANIVMGEDIGGKNGAPETNIYSISKNDILTGTHFFGGQSEYYNPLFEEEESNLGEGNFEPGAGGNDMEKLDSLKGAIKQKLEENKEAIKKELNSKTSGIVSSYTSDNKEETGNITTEEGGASSTRVSFELTVDKDPANVTKQDILTIISALETFMNEEQRKKVDNIKKIVDALPEEHISRLYKKLRDLESLSKDILKSQIDRYISKLKNIITGQTDQVKSAVTDYINEKKDSLVSTINRPVRKSIDSLGKIAVKKARQINSKGNYSQIIHDVKNSVKTSIAAEIQESFDQSVADNITDPLRSYVDSAVNRRIFSFINSTLTASAHSLIEDQNLKSVDEDQIFKDAKNMIPDMAEDFRETFIGNNGEKIIIRIKNTGYGVVDNYNWKDVTGRIVEQLIQKIGESKGEEFVEKTFNNIAGDEGGDVAKSVASTAAENIEMDFDNIGEKVKDGEIGKIVKFDPSYITVETKVADFEGYVNHTKDDPIWGDSWQAELTASLKIEPAFTVNAKYVNGTSNQGANNFKYWFLEIGAEGLNVPIPSIPLTLDGAGGKVYKHMAQKEAGSDTYRPNKSTKFGVGLDMLFFDTPAKGATLTLDVGMEVSFMENGFMLEMNGEALMANQTKSAGEITNSVGEAEGFLNYNTAENHFLGNFEVTVEQQGALCAGGEMIIDISKDDWRVAVGTREERVYVNPLCLESLSLTGWFDMSQTKLDMGLVYDFRFRAESPWIPIGCKIKPWAEMAFNMGATTIVLWEPNFDIEEAHVWIDIYVGLGVKYKCAFKKGNLKIAEVNVGGELLFTTIPKTTLSGEAHGSVTILGATAGFDLQVDQTL